ncbi:MAG: ABC transporter substrate-binding protein [Aristaeellaceae bacterium]
MKKLLVTLLVCALVIVSVGAVSCLAEGTKKIGFAESTYSGDWRACEVADVTAAAEAAGYELIMTNADNDVQKQIADVEDLIAQGCDLIVIVPVDAEAIAPAFEACKEAGIPVIDMDTQYLSGVRGVDFITTIRSDQYAQGQAAAEWMVEQFGTEEAVTVLEITGSMGQSDAQNRHNGFADYIVNYPNFEVVTQSGDWSATTAQNVVTNVAQTTEFQAIYCHGADMVPGIILGLKQSNLAPTDDVKVITVDSPYTALDSIIAGELTAAITCTPRGGSTLFSVIDAYYAGEELEDTYFVPQATIDASNVEEVYDVEGF